MPQTQKEKLKEEFEKRFGTFRVGAKYYPSYSEKFLDRVREPFTEIDIKDFFLSRTIPIASLQELVEKIEEEVTRLKNLEKIDMYRGDDEKYGRLKSLSLCKDLLLTCLKENE